MNNWPFSKKKKETEQKNLNEQKERELNFEKSVRLAAENAYKKALEDICGLEYKKTGPSGMEAVDYEMTVRMIRNRAGLALAFVKNISKKDGENQ